MKPYTYTDAIDGATLKLEPGGDTGGVLLTASEDGDSASVLVRGEHLDALVHALYVAAKRHVITVERLIDEETRHGVWVIGDITVRVVDGTVQLLGYGFNVGPDTAVRVAAALAQAAQTVRTEPAVADVLDLADDLARSDPDWTGPAPAVRHVEQARYLLRTHFVSGRDLAPYGTGR